jgi:hypothetical protein
LNGRTNREYRLEKFSKGRAAPAPYRHRRPFWLPASNYYVLTAAVTIAFFFAVWGILNDDGEETPWVPAGMAASVVLGSAVFLREVVLRKARLKFLDTQKQLDANLKSVFGKIRANTVTNKLTIEQNAAIIKEIKRKSDAARLLRKISDGHLEVFEICNEYLSLNKQQMETVGIGSPRLAALRRGKQTVEELHHLHLLSWAQNETLALTRESKIRVTIQKKLESAQRALLVLNSALEFYPNDRQLIESENALKEFIISIKVSHWMEQAERAAFKGNYNRAVNHYQDALFFMSRENIQSEEMKLTTDKIKAEIEKLRAVSEEKI